MDYCVVLIKPDGMQRGLMGEVVKRLEQKGLQLVGAKMLKMTDQILDKWYEHHIDKPFFPSLKAYMMQTPILATVWTGVETAKTIRILLGVTKGRDALPGTIRGDFAMSQQFNLVHASESAEAAQKEKSLIFTENEIFSWNKQDFPNIYAEEEIK